MQGQRTRHSCEIKVGVFCLVVLLSGTAFAQIVSEGERYLLRKSTTMPDGRVKVGTLAVEPGKDGAEARVKTFVLEGGNFKEELITMSELAKWPSPIKGFHFGVSTDDELVLVDKDTAEGPVVGILQNARGKHDVPSRNLKEWLAGGISITKATRTADGRFRTGEAPSTKQVATSQAKPVDSVLTDPDGVDLAIIQAAKQKADELKASITPMFVDAKGSIRTWPPSPYPSHFTQGDMLLNVCSKPVTVDDITLGKGEVVVLERTPGEGGELVWVKAPWCITTGRSIWVSLVGNHGRKAKTDVQVYVLSDEEFSQYWAKREMEETPNLKPRGIVPLLVQDIKPGRYVVGVQYTLDLSVIRQSAISGKLDPLDYMEDDVADASEIRASTVEASEAKLELIVSCIRWYAVDVASETVHPVVSLLIPKGAPPSTRRGLYPSGKQFRINASRELLEQLWQSMERAGAKMTTQQREELLDQLAKGGRVCVPGTTLPTAIFLDCDGKPRLAGRDRKQTKPQ